MIEILQEIVRKIQNLVLDYKTTIEAQRKEYWNVQITKLHSDVKTHRRGVTAKILQIRNSVSFSSSALPNQSVPNDDLNKRQVEASEMTIQLKRLEIEENKKLFDQNQKNERDKSVQKAKVLYASVIADANKLEEKVYEISDGSAQDDISVGKGMREAKEWKDEMDKVISKVRELKFYKWNIKC